MNARTVTGLHPAAAGQALGVAALLLGLGSAVLFLLAATGAPHASGYAVRAALLGLLTLAAGVPTVTRARRAGRRPTVLAWIGMASSVAATPLAVVLAWAG